ncbi:MAG: hypothetical protein OWU84_06980 [Firmicutes bacterium]|nr:hypothetical protein [Bacillota bacterium]
MRVPIPPETRREFDGIAGLSGTGLLVATTCLAVAATLWEAHWLPVAELRQYITTGLRDIEE